MLMALKARKETYKKTEVESSPFSYIFHKKGDPALPMYPTAPTRWLSKFIGKYGLPNVSPHDLRRTWATLANEAGLSQKAIQENLGHTDGSDVDSRHYIKLTTAGQISALETMHSVFYGDPQKPEQEQKQAQ